MDKKPLNKMVNWLTESNIRSSNGAVYSWINTAKPGYVYQEIIGYYIKWCCWLAEKGQKRYLQLAKKSADYLAANLSANGAASREGIDYVFDSAMCLSGFMALAKTDSLSEEQYKAAEKLARFIVTNLEKKNPTVQKDKPAIDKNRWSLSYGCLLIKCCIALYEYYEFTKEAKYKSLALSMTENLISKTFKTDHFVINEWNDFVYTHPHCYATEGLIYLASKGCKLAKITESSAVWLAKKQNADGSLYNWYGNSEPLQKQGDATAQAARIWLLVNKNKYSGNMQKALKFLHSLQSEEGGLFYNSNSADCNSWVTLFASQAFYWELNKAEPEWII